MRFRQIAVAPGDLLTSGEPRGGEPSDSGKTEELVNLDVSDEKVTDEEEHHHEGAELDRGIVWLLEEAN